MEKEKNEVNETESALFLRAIIETANDAIISADGSGAIIGWNKAAETVFSFSANEAIGKPLTILMPERSHALHRKGFQQYLATRQPRLIGTTVELVGKRKSGSEFPLELSLASWKVDGKFFFAAIIRDVSLRKQTEQALEAAKRELEERVHELETLNRIMMDREERILELKNEIKNIRSVDEGNFRKGGQEQ